jgi:hypothetical protein
MNYNLFELAEKQILREGKNPSDLLILDYAVKIRQWLDKHNQNIANKIMQGQKVYYYGNTIKTYKRIGL